MDLKDFYHLILRNLFIVVFMAILGVGVAAGITYKTTPQYEAKIELFVSTPSSAFDISALAQGSSFSQQRVKSYAQIVNSPQVLDPVIKQLNLSTTSDQLAKRVKASAPLDTVLIDISVTDPSPTRAADIANAIGNQFSITANDLEAANASGAQTIKVSVVKSAFVPQFPSSPKKSLNILLGLILGFGLGVGLAILRLTFDNTMKNEEDLDGTQLLAVIGYDPAAEKSPLISTISKYASRTEAYRQLRTNLNYSKGITPPRTIAVTSALPGEGKTTSSINLAIALAQSGFKTIVVEADLRRAKMAYYFGHSKSELGLSDVLKQATLDDPEKAVRLIVKEIPIGDDNSLSVLFGGHAPQNPAELLDSNNFRELLGYLARKYEYVIVDCPPTLPVADASIIATQVDGVVIVVKANQTRRVQYYGVRDSILNVGGTVLGATLNMVPASRVYGDYGYRYGYGYKGNYGYKGEYAPNTSKPKKKFFRRKTQQVQS